VSPLFFEKKKHIITSELPKSLQVNWINSVLKTIESAPPVEILRPTNADVEQFTVPVRASFYPETSIHEEHHRQRSPPAACGKPPSPPMLVK
jgi:hypothetical protein